MPVAPLRDALRVLQTEGLLTIHPRSGIRFLKPVFLGDTITIDYVIAEIDSEKRRATADVRIINQNGDLVAVATHLLQWVGA